jgi:hypothetical protein
MKKVILIVISIVIILGGLYVLMSIDGKNNDKESKTYVDKIVPLIMSNFDFLEMAKNASPEMKETLNTKTGSEAMKMFQKKYGKFIKYEGSAGESVQYFTLKGIIMTAEYKCKITYENGSIQITINLIKHSSVWQILNFNLNL